MSVPRERDKWQCAMCGYKHDPDEERMILAGRGELYDGEDCSLCATTRRRGEQEDARGKQGDDDEGTEDPEDDGETGGCHRQDSKMKKLGVGDIRRHMGSPEARKAGQAHLGAVLHEKGTGTGKEAASIKYLGVWFETGWGWGKQLEVLRKKQQEMTKRLREAKVPVEVAVHAVNTKIIPALAYPLQVAIVKDTVMHGWDRQLREAVRAAGHLPCHLPV